MDPTTLIITYACDHNHPIPTKSHLSSTTAVPVSATSSSSGADEIPTKVPADEIAVFSGQAALDLSEGSAALLSGCGYYHHRHQWFDEDDAVSRAVVLESPIFEGGGGYLDGDVSMAFSSVSGEDESLFGDLGELPECSVVFRRRIVEPDEKNRRCSLSAVPCCGSSG